jgi:phosphopantothenate synthetase
MRTNGWRAELTLTARLGLSAHSRGETFDRAIPLRIRFPREMFPASAVEAQVEELDVAERV